MSLSTIMSTSMSLKMNTEIVKSPWMPQNAESVLLNATRFGPFVNLDKMNNSGVFEMTNITTSTHVEAIPSFVLSQEEADTIARMFISMGSSNWWLVMAILSIALSTYTFRNVTLNISTRTIAYTNFIASIICTIPFFIFMVYKVTWGGSGPVSFSVFLSENTHFVSMLLWLLCSFAMILSICFGFVELHKKLGWFAMNIHLPFIVTELSTNAAPAFKASKLVPLAQAHWAHAAADPTALQLAAVCLFVAVPAFTPALTGMYWWSGRSIFDKKRIPSDSKRYALHITYMSMLNLVVFSAGTGRCFARALFPLTGCPSHRDNVVSSMVQALSAGYASVPNLIITNILYATLPLEMRVGPKKIPGVQLTYIVYVGMALLQWFSMYAFDFSSFFRCDAEITQHFFDIRGA